MAAQFTEITLEDMETFLKRAFRAMRPRRGESRGEVYYDLNLTKGKIFVRVWTSIRPGSGIGAGKGEDAIRVTMVTSGGKPLMPKGKIVKRTQNWRSSLQDRVEELLETFESKTQYWTTRQEERDSGAPKSEPTGPAREPETKPGEKHEGQFSRLDNGNWGAKIFGEARPGDTAILRSQGGRTLNVKLVEQIRKGPDRFERGRYAEVWTFDAPGRRNASEGPDPVEIAVIERALGVTESGD